jgi:hypothetical protein
MLYTLLIAGTIYAQTPDMETCQVMRSMVVTDMMTQVVNKSDFTVDEWLFFVLSEMVVCKPGVQFSS